MNSEGAVAKKTAVAVIFGGQSSEHSISCLSAASVLAALDPDKYDVEAIGIDRSGIWYRVSADPLDWARTPGGLPTVDVANPAVHGKLDISELAADVVFPALHGPFGEDGTIQGALELLGIAYVGSGVLASALTMDKQTTKIMLAAAGLPVGSSVTVTDADWSRNREAVLSDVGRLRFPVFVKPARAGSSIGIAKVPDLAGVESAVWDAREHDRKVVIEESIEGAREIECGVLANPGHEAPTASICAEITVSDEHDFYDFDAKYLDNSATLTVPADLPATRHTELGALAIEAFTALGADGLSRVDFFLDRAGDVVINEVNTMPGFTNISMFPRMWQESGMSYPELIDHLLAVAIDRGSGLR
ncbi:MAG: D-alanine--D-alanine ligase [Actinobacteria bacterium]|nr:D-alanine--D-alanine ligase [Actinomycetota bacterium]